MDKNFINVDDLVRQRLEGREEREPSGAWLNMRELLDEEMPQRKLVPFFWNRMFGAVGILALLGLISVGGYEFSVNKESGHNAPVASVTTVATPAEKAHDAVNTEAANQRQLSATGINDDAVNHSDITGTPVQKGGHKKATNKVNNTDVKTPKAAMRTADAGHTPGGNTPANNSTAAHNKKDASASTDAAHTVAKNNAQNNGADNTPIASVATNTPAGNSADAATAGLPVKHNSNKQAKTAKHRDGAIAANTAHSKTNKTQKGAIAQPAAVAMNTDNNSNLPTPGTANKMAASDAVTDVNNMPLGSNSSSGNAVTPSVAAKMSTGNNTVNTTNAPAANGNVNVPGNTTGNPSATGIAGNGAGNGAQKSVPAKLPNNSTANNSKGKRTIERMVVFQRAIKTDQNESQQYHVDTISIETLTEELGMSASSSSIPNAATKKANLSNMISNTTGADNAPVVPGAAANAANNAPGNVAKTNAATKNSSSVSPVEKLKEEFNDVKTKVSLIRFAPGLTAGVNGTFFGPNSFKGFQFGLTGELFFNDDLGLMTEFKYIHRINNDFQVNDNYYNYLNNGTKQLVLNSYSFSALHSLELPISIRYSKGNFTFIAGGNIVYSFSINTGAATIVSPTAPIATSIAPAQATDNKPQLNASDFNSRFGLGYLFGFAYKVSPNVTLDLRDVQSFWDNAKDGGAKSVSTQLYKSPSFQFSLNYRLGKKNRGE